MAAHAKRVLLVSGSVGLGRATRDLAIAVAMRRERPDVTPGWLAGNPAREWLREAGEWVPPEADACGDLGQVAERAAGSGQMNLDGYARLVSQDFERNVIAFQRSAPICCGQSGWTDVTRLYEHPTAADLAVVKGGGPTTIELTAL